ncbi:hypothetical protein D0Y65_021830 [Glycine soja]|uniref:Protein sel-1-like 1 n=1 Tax=Glycine soja TaxID=3848 RepID=A0A445JKW3_GLYSO|nr:hypothetical protein D0Y65_021830 [Glycine soja]
MLPRALLAKFILKPSTVSPFQFNQQRALHSRNKKALEFIAKGWNALKEVDRVIDYSDPKHSGIVSLLRTAKENFELALEADNTNTHARYWLSRLHMKYPVPGANKAVGAALLVEAAEMGDPEAQYALGCHLRVENDYVQSDQQAFYYLEKAVDQLHPGALYLLGAVYLTGDCVRKDIASALWCFHRASEKFALPPEVHTSSLAHPPSLEITTSAVFSLLMLCYCFLHFCYLPGHAGAAIAYGSLLLKGVEVPESVIKFSLTRGAAAHRRGRNKGALAIDPVEMAREKFQIAAKAGCELGFKWLARLEEEEKRALTGEH